MSSSIDRLLDEELPPGLYSLDMSLHPAAICRRATERGWCCAHVDGRRVIDKQSLLDQIAAALSFPDYFGHNWDALEECMTDLSWIQEPGFVLLYDHAAVLVAQHPNVWDTLWDVFQSTFSYWSERSRPVYVVLRNTGRTTQQVPSL